jgi:hypothetical protein
MVCCLTAEKKSIFYVCSVILLSLFINAFVGIYGVGTTIRETQVVIAEGYKSVNDCVGPFTQIDYVLLDEDFDKAVSNTHWSLAMLSTSWGHKLRRYATPIYNRGEKF